MSMGRRGGLLAQRHLTIVGLGLMGGSLALALRGKCAGITAVDSNSQALAAGLERGAVNHATESLAEGVAYADLLVLATPVSVIMDLLAKLPQLTPRSEVTLSVMDIGSTKAEITAKMSTLPEEYNCIGGHPMCGKETSGIAHANANLYQNAKFVLTSLANTSLATLDLSQELVLAAGAQPLHMEAYRHDRMVALTSHLPYLLACSLVATVEEHGKEDSGIWDLAATGFRDTARVAASDVPMLIDILNTNKDAVRAALGQQRRALELLDAALDGDEAILNAALGAIRTAYRSHFPPASAER